MFEVIAIAFVLGVLCYFVVRLCFQVARLEIRVASLEHWRRGSVRVTATGGGGGGGGSGPGLTVFEQMGSGSIHRIWPPEPPQATEAPPNT